MKFSHSVIACILCVIATVYAVSVHLETLAIISRILFKVFLFLALFEAGKIKLTKTFIVFASIILSADVLSLFAVNLDARLGYLILILFFGMYMLLFKDAWKQFKMNRVNYTAWSFAGVLVLNALLIGLHLRALITGFEGHISIVVGQTFYNLALYAMIALSLAYYLNSYSKKSMLFLVANIAFLCSDILNGAFYFYGVGDFILPFSVLLSAAGYVFIFNYFTVDEEPLMLESDILLEIKAMEQRKLKHQVRG